MGTIRKMGSNWQCMVRIKDHPQLSKSFKTNADAKRWGIETELKIRREDATKYLRCLNPLNAFGHFSSS